MAHMSKATAKQYLGSDQASQKAESYGSAHGVSSSDLKLGRTFQAAVAQAKSFVKLMNVRPLLCLMLAGCAHLSDDLPLEPLALAVERDAALAGPSLHFKDKQVSHERYSAALRELAAAARQGRRQLLELVQRRFELVELTGPMLVTSYYEPTVPGARARTARFSQALYALPPETLRGATRADIDGHHALDGNNLELAFVEPFDAFVLAVEGSGNVDFGDGKLALDYGGTNGQPHVRLGPFLPESARRNMPSMEAHLRALPPEGLRAILDKDPRYTYFQPRRGDGPKTKIGVAAVDGRTIAVDPSLPHGTVALLETTHPDGKLLRRLVLAEDTGGGIRGARVDLFWGRDEEAHQQAGLMKQRGRLYFLVPR
jgi:membrane-bound lytic murein transglycosylase A